MATIRPEISERSRYWLERHRYYELKHFCLQYPLWKKAYEYLEGLESLGNRPIDLAGVVGSGGVGDPTWKCVEAREYFLERMEMIERVATATEKSISNYIFEGVTEGIPYEQIMARHSIPCCRDVYYILYRKFFWLLSRERE